MANVNVSASPFKVDAIASYLLGGALETYPSTHVIQFVGATFTGSLTVKARVKGSGLAYVAIPYVRRNLGGTAQDDTPVIAALTADFLIKLDSTGLDIMLDCTALSAGTGTVGYRILAGPDA